MCVNQNIETLQKKFKPSLRSDTMEVKGREGTTRSEEYCNFLRLLLLFCVSFLVTVVVDVVFLMGVNGIKGQQYEKCCYLEGYWCYFVFFSCYYCYLCCCACACGIMGVKGTEGHQRVRKNVAL